MKSSSMKKIMMKQKGFTLLELLVVITLLAILSVGAILAYDGVGDNALATAAAKDTTAADQAIRNFKGVTFNFPNQWDNLVTVAGAPLAFAAEATNDSLVLWAPAVPFRDAVAARFAAVGVDELQVRVNPLLTPGVVPNLQHNEGAVTTVVGTPALALAQVREMDFGGATGVTNFAALPSRAACAAGGQVLDGAAGTLAGNNIPVPLQGARQNVINDDLEADQCHLVMAFGFGNDAAASTTGSPVAIAAAPTFTSRLINPATTYARYIALFHVGADGANGAVEDQDVTTAELFATPRLLAVVDTAGNVIETNRAAAGVR